MQWLGLDWDEGPLKGGDFGPYRQSERTDIYLDVLAQLRGTRFTYDCYCTTEEVEARRKASGSKVMGYDGFCRELTDEQLLFFEEEGRKPVVRFRMPDGSLTWDDLVRGEITFETEFVPDFALCRANGDPLYTLVNPVDDALMEITHVLRGEDLLSSTPRQLALYEALTELGIAKQVPRFGHLPYVMGEGNKKLSKRDPKAHLIAYRDAGFLPEGLLNYLALLGWAIAADRDVFTLDEMVAAFDIGDVNPNPARFDEKKADAINAAHMRMLSVEEMTERVLPFLEAAGVLAPGVAAGPPAARPGDAAGRRADQQAHRGADDARLPVRRRGRVRGRRRDRRRRPATSCARRTTCCRRSRSGRPPRSRRRCRPSWSTSASSSPASPSARCASRSTGRKVSPPLFESLELLGRDRSLGRLLRARRVTHNPYGGWPPPGYVHPQPPAPAAPVGSVEYHLIQRTGAAGRWRPASASSPWRSASSSCR